MKVIPTERRGKGPYCILNSHTLAVGGGASSAPPVCIILLRIWFLKMKGKLRNFTVRMCVLEPVSSGCGPRDICSFHLFRVLHFLEMKQFLKTTKNHSNQQLEMIHASFLWEPDLILMILAAGKRDLFGPVLKRATHEFWSTWDSEQAASCHFFFFLRGFLPFLNSSKLKKSHSKISILISQIFEERSQKRPVVNSPK